MERQHRGVLLNLAQNHGSLLHGLNLVHSLGEEINAHFQAHCGGPFDIGLMEDRSTLLKTSDGQQVFVQEGESYREAVFADYYTAPKFFVKGEQKYTGWQTIDGKVYYYTADGTKVVGEQIIQGAKYNFASDGSPSWWPCRSCLHGRRWLPRR